MFLMVPRVKFKTEKSMNHFLFVLTIPKQSDNQVQILEYKVYFGYGYYITQSFHLIYQMKKMNKFYLFEIFYLIFHRIKF